MNTSLRRSPSLITETRPLNSCSLLSDSGKNGLLARNNGGQVQKCRLCRAPIKSASNSAACPLHGPRRAPNRKSHRRRCKGLSSFLFTRCCHSGRLTRALHLEEPSQQRCLRKLSTFFAFQAKFAFFQFKVLLGKRCSVYLSLGQQEYAQGSYLE